MTTTTGVNGTSAAAPTTTTNAAMADASDRFLKLLVTQMQNQDPLNPLDNAQVTSQMAQINTVTGIDKLNTTMANMSASFTQMQMLQGASLVGHGVMLEGDKLHFDEEGTTAGAYELSAAAANVRIEIVNSAGVVVDTISEQGKAAGRQGFTWTAPEGTDTKDLRFKVTATTDGKTTAVSTLMSDYVAAVSNTDGALTLELAFSGSTPYSKVKALA